MKKMDDIWGKYFKIETINSNAISDIYKGKNRTTKEYVSIKEIKKIKVNDSDKLIKNEIEIIKQLNSENTLLPIETIESLDSYFIVSEIYNMTLEEYIKKRKEPLSIDEIKEILFELNKLFKSMN
jgi:serine/threonine protein kinase